MLNQKPSLFRVVSVDYSSLLSVMFPAVFWFASGYFHFTGDDSLELFVIIAIASSVIGIPFLIWRYWTISSVFDDGMEVQGIILGVGFFRGRGRVDYTYTFQGQKYQSSNSINRSKYTRNLRDGQTATLLVNRENPKQAFIKEIYL